MTDKIRNVIAFLPLAVLLLLGASSYYGATNFDRLVLGEGNFGTDPSTTSDIVLQNDETISNSTDGTVSISGTLSTSLNGDTNSFQRTPVALGNNQKFYDTVTISGSVATSVYMVSIRKSGQPVAGDLLAWSSAVTGVLIVQRADTTTANQTYSYLKVK